jgi:hypothetical protein
MVHFRSFLSLLLVQFYRHPSFCQHADEEQIANDEVLKHRIFMMIGHTHVPKGVVRTGDGGLLIIPSRD